MKIVKKEIYSNIEEDLLLHIICKTAPTTSQENREDLIPPDNFIQCSHLKLPYGKTFKPHKHIKKERHYKSQIAQESWVVIRGKVKCILYDINDEVIHTDILGPGEASFTLEGGHTYRILEPDTLVYEYKTGPYEGQALDKVFLDVQD